MTRFLSAVVVLGVALVVMPLTAAPVPKSVKNQNREKADILGDWLEPPEKARIWWFKEDGTAGGGDLKSPTRRGQYRLDPTTDPKQLDWSDDGGATWQLGVYHIVNDTLTVNIAANTRDARPVSMDETPKSNKIVATRKPAEK
jgi:uncharacterized protein (TIGR03067 family)